MNQKRLVSLAVVVLLIIAVLSGCAKKSATSTESMAASTPTASTVSTAPEQTAVQTQAPQGDDWSKQIEISWMMYGTPRDNGYREQYLEKKYNVKLKMIWVEGADFDKKKALKLSSGEIPDIVLDPNPADIAKDAQQGFLAEISPEMIKQIAPDYVNLLNNYAPHAWLYSNYAGKNYGLPYFNVYQKYVYVPVWRMDLLESVGITKVPETLDEFEAAYKALKTKKIYGSTDNFAWFWTQFNDIFGAYGIEPYVWLNQDGKIVYGATTPQMKDALTLLSKWYKEGYIDPEFVTDDPGKMDQKLLNGKVAYENVKGSPETTLDESDPNSAISLAKKVNPKAKLAIGVLPKGPGGQHTFAWGTGDQIYGFGKQLEKDPEKLTRILTMLQGMFTDEEVAVQTTIGEKGTHWEYKIAGDAASGIKPLDPYSDSNQAAKQGFNPWFNVYGLPGAQPDMVDKYLPKSSVDFRNKWQEPFQAIVDVFGKSDVIPSYAKYGADLQKLTTEMIAKIIRGEKPISYFDDFVTQWKAKGGTVLEEEANKEFASLQDIIKKVQ